MKVIDVSIIWDSMWHCKIWGKKWRSSYR